MSDRSFVLMVVLGLMLMGMMQTSLAADDQPDRTPGAVATTSSPVADRDSPVPDGPEAALEHAADAVAAGRWLAAAGFILWAMTALVRRYLGGVKAWGGRLAWLRTDRGGVVTVLVLAALGEVGLLLSSGRWPTLSGLMGALAAAWVASGGRTQISRFLHPRDGAAAVT